LLAGWNSAESNYHGLLGGGAPTVENYEATVRKIYGDKADAVLSLYKATSTDEVRQVATDLATDRFIAFSTWKWIDMQTKTGGKPVYRYLYAHPRPAVAGGPAGGEPVMGAGHSWEIEYALGNLKTNKVYDWTPEDDKVSEIMQAYFANFITTGNPNGKELPAWAPMKAAGVSEIMVIDVNTRSEKEKHAERYRWMDSAR
jgi:para-nitrobenzyl esterase